MRREPGVPGARARARALAMGSALALALAPVFALAVACTLAQGAVVPLAATPRPDKPTLVMGLKPGFPRVRYPGGLISLNDRCIVKGSRLSTEIRPVYVNGLPIAFCCTTCPAVFAGNPEPWLERAKIRLQCPVEPSRPAALGKSTRLFVNQDVFYFSRAAARAKFARDPLRYCGTLTDPVTHERFRPTPASPHLVRAGRDYWFVRAQSRARFLSAPDSFAVRRGGPA